MSIMFIAMVRELGIMHLMFGVKAYKTTFGVVIQALGPITNFPIRVGDV
jgi:hypothetical protein